MFSFVLVFTSCIKEDMDDCPVKNITLNFKYLIEGKNEFSNYISDGTVYVYDAITDDLVMSKDFTTDSELAASQKTVWLEGGKAQLSLLLPVGEYIIVADGGNRWKNIEVNGEDNYNTLYVSNISDENNTGIKSSPHIGLDKFYNTRTVLPISVVSLEEAIEETIDFSCRHLQFQVNFPDEYFKKLFVEGDAKLNINIDGLHNTLTTSGRIIPEKQIYFEGNKLSQMQNNCARFNTFIHHLPNLEDVSFTIKVNEVSLLDKNNLDDISHGLNLHVLNPETVIQINLTPADLEIIWKGEESFPSVD